MNKILEVLALGMVAAMCLVAAYGMDKPKEKMMGKSGYMGAAHTLTGWITGMNCFTMGHTYDPEHVWKYHEATGFATADGKFYFLADVPADTLVYGFTKQAVVKGMFYDEASVADVGGLKLASGSGWDLVYGSDFSDKPENSMAGTMKGTMLKGELKGFQGVISGAHCVFMGMLCSPDHIWTKGEYSGLVTKDNKFINIIGLPANFIPANFTKEFYMHGIYYPQTHSLLVHHVAKNEKGAPIWENPEVLKMAGEMKM
ncbi:MAG: hypothetical protein ACREJQ_08325 [bacterium]